MKNILIIPDKDNINRDLELADKYSLGFEYNDFFNPSVIDDNYKVNELVNFYNDKNDGIYSTLHGCFYDVIPFSLDEKIKEVSLLRIEQSIDVAKRLGAKGVVFHTNYNSFFKAEAYIKQWLDINEEFWKSILMKHKDINIYIENMFEENPDVIEQLADRLYECNNFGICLDYAHAAIGQVAPDEWARRIGKYVKHIHINDNDLISDLHLAWGNGKIERIKFYDAYAKYMEGASVLVENALYDDKVKTLEVLRAEGFI